ncbi:hypothetical protein X992_5485 [Burkholderia pseudomallei MSHR5492]|nr:hypothetical protein X992_5485 [Burkholderia pseudomallei MSHR5492]
MPHLSGCGGVSSRIGNSLNVTWCAALVAVTCTNESHRASARNGSDSLSCGLPRAKDSDGEPLSASWSTLVAAPQSSGAGWCRHIRRGIGGLQASIGRFPRRRTAYVPEGSWAGRLRRRPCIDRAGHQSRQGHDSITVRVSGASFTGP